MPRALLILALATGLAAQDGGIEVFAGETLFESGFRVSLTEIVRERTDMFRGSDTIGNPLNQSVEETRSVLGFDYGFDREATLSLLVPYVDRDVNLGGIRSSADGIGDAALLGKYRIHKDEGHAETFNVALVGGLELPTGATDETLNGLRLQPAAQVGKGALNPFLAIASTYGQGRARFDGVVFYKHNTEGAQNRQDGDFFSASLSAAYRFLHFKYPGPTFGAKLGLQYRHEARAHFNGAPLPNSGADELLLTPALSIHPVPAMDMVLGARIPIYQHYAGTQLGRDLDFIFAVGWRF